MRCIKVWNWKWRLTYIIVYVLCGVDAACFGNALIFCLIASFTPCICLYTCSYRSRLRRKYNLKETPCNDCCVHCWCWSCAMCQEYRELKNRGFNMHIGIFPIISLLHMFFLLKKNHILIECVMLRLARKCAETK